VKLFFVLGASFFMFRFWAAAIRRIAEERARVARFRDGAHRGYLLK